MTISLVFTIIFEKTIFFFIKNTHICPFFHFILLLMINKFIKYEKQNANTKQTLINNSKPDLPLFIEVLTCSKYYNEKIKTKKKHKRKILIVPHTPFVCQSLNKYLEIHKI